MIFLSYSRADIDFAELLAERLHHAGFEVWWDEEIPPGKDFRHHLDERLNDASAIVVCWSPHSAKSRWVTEEAEEGASRQILIPVICQPTEIPRGFRNFHTADLSCWDGEEHHPDLQHVLSELAQLEQRSARPSGPQIVSRERTRSLKRRATRNAGIMMLGMFVLLAFSVWDYFESDNGLSQSRYRLQGVIVFLALAVANWFVRGETSAAWVWAFSVFTMGVVSLFVNAGYTHPELGLASFATPLNLLMILAWGIGLGATKLVPAIAAAMGTIAAYILALTLFSDASTLFIAASSANIAVVSVALCASKSARKL